VALLAAELKGSREAAEAEVNEVPDGDANQAIHEAEVFLYSILGFRVEVPEGSISVRGQSHSTIYLPERVRSISALTEDGRTVSGVDYTLKARGWILKHNGAVWLHSSDEPNIVISGAFGYAPDEPQYELAKRIVKLLAIRALQSTQPNDNFPTAPAGAYVTGITSEGVTATFFTPKGEMTGFADIDRLIKPLRAQKPRGRGRLISVPVESAIRP
jgi:hypothetical protein